MFWKHLLEKFFLSFMLFLTPMAGFIFMIFLSLFFCSISSSFFFIWMSLELNMISVLPLLSAKESLFNSELSLKYFISQSIASILFLSMVFVMMILPKKLFLLLFILSIVFKMGIPPFQSWFMSISMISSYPSLWILCTIQKFIPIQIIFLLKLNEKLSLFLIIMSFVTVISSMKNILSVRVSMIFSAFSNSIWMIMIANYSKIWIFYLIFYSVMLASTLTFLNMFSINKIFSFNFLNLIDKIMFNFNFLNLGGLPPFMGFLIKIFALKILIHQTFLLELLMLVFLSLSILISYLMVSYYSFSLSKSKNFFLLNSQPSKIFLMSSLTIFSFPMVLLFFY